MKTRHSFVVCITLLLGSLPLAAAAQQAPAPHASEEAAEQLVELVLRGMDGAERRLSDYRGRIVVLNFWATWCVPCREEMPMLVRLQQEYESRGVVVIGPSADAPETQAQIAPFLKELQIQFPIWVGATTEHMQRLRLGTALPATAVIDRDGRIAGRILGPLDETDLRARLEWLLADPATRGPAPVPVLNTFEEHQHAPGETTHNEHAHKEEHAHAPGMDGSSTVPS